MNREYGEALRVVVGFGTVCVAEDDQEVNIPYI